MKKQAHHKVTKGAKGRKASTRDGPRYLVTDDSGREIARVYQFNVALWLAVTTVAQAVLSQSPDRPKRWAMIEWTGEDGSRWFEIVKVETVRTSTSPDFLEPSCLGGEGSGESAP